MRRTSISGASTVSDFTRGCSVGTLVHDITASIWGSVSETAPLASCSRTSVSCKRGLKPCQLDSMCPIVTCCFSTAEARASIWPRHWSMCGIHHTRRLISEMQKTK